MSVDSSTYPSDIEDHLPNVIERLASSNADPTNVPDVFDIIAAVVRLWLNDSVVVFTRSQVEAELELAHVSSTTISNRLKALVEAGVLTVDTTRDAHRFTLAVPYFPEDAPVETWKSETESFIPTTWDGIKPKEPAYIVIESDPETTRWEMIVDPEQWPAYGRPITAGDKINTRTSQESKTTDEKNLDPTTQLPNTGSAEPACVCDQSNSHIPIAEASTNQYAKCGAIARKVTAGFGVGAIVAGGLFGQLPVALAVVVLALFAFSAWVALGIFGSITDRWRDPADTRPADIANRLTGVV